jgi:hypothetical protein
MARRQSRDPLERLDTPAFMTRALLAHMPKIATHHIVEPCAGAGAIVEVLRHDGKAGVIGFDIEPRAGGIVQADTIALTDWTKLGAIAPSALVTNPPFSLAANYWRLGRAFDVTVLLVRQTWLEVSRDREDISDPDAMVLMPRVKFTGPGAIDPETGKPYTSSDSAACCWAIWAKDKRVLPARPIIRVARPPKAKKLARKVAA